MKCFVLLAFLNLIAVGRAAALKAPSAAEIAAIQLEIDKVKDIQNRPNGVDTYLKKIANEEASPNAKKDPIASKERIASHQANINALRAQQAPICRQILLAVKRAYDIHPSKWTAPIPLDKRYSDDSEANAFADDLARWDPKVADLDAEMSKNGQQLERKVHNGKIEDHTMQDPLQNGRVPGAVTWPNGEIEVGISEFLYSPGWVASVVVHETVHLRQMVTPYGANRPKTTLDAETEAFREQEKASKTVLGLTASELADLKARETRELAWVKTHNANFVIKAGKPEALPEGARLAPTNERLEDERVRGDADFVGAFGDLQGVSQDAVAIFNEHDRQLRAEGIRLDQEEKRKAEERKREAQEDLKRLAAEKDKRLKEAWGDARRQSARVCGFTEYFDDNDPGLEVGFLRGKNGYEAGPNARFFFRADASLDDGEIMAAFTLANACMDASNLYGQGANWLCGGGLEVLLKRWSDPAFRQQLYLDGWLRSSVSSHLPAPVECVAYVIERARQPLDRTALFNALAAYRSEAERRKRAIEKWEREHPAPVPRSPAPPQKQSGNGGGGGERQGGGSGQNFCESRGHVSNGSGRCFGPAN